MTEYMTPSLLERLGTLWRDLVPAKADNPLERIPADLPDESVDAVLQQMQACLDQKGGDVSARVRAANLGRVYLWLNEEGRRKFLTLLVEEFGTNDAAIDEAADRLRDAPDPVERHKAASALRRALEAPYLTLLTQFNALPNGVKFLVDMRAEAMRFARDEPKLKTLDADMKILLGNWFDVGFLELRRLTWESPANVLEKIFAYEAVHAIGSWNDLKNRLDSDRRLYAFFHPRMPDEPLIFVQVALLKGLAGNIQELLDIEAPVGDPQEADTAIFYSISNAQKGLAGISFGNFLIKRVVSTLLGDFPNLKNFATLSPIPGFRAWLEANAPDDEGEDAGEAGETTVLGQVATKLGLRDSKPRIDVKEILARPDWHLDEAAVATVKESLMTLAARYLAQEKNKRGGVLRARDPVTHFHLSNGARIERINWLADTSVKGLAQSAGMMVNYLYKLNEIDRNHEAYIENGTAVLSSGVASLVKGSGR